MHLFYFGWAHARRGIQNKRDERGETHGLTTTEAELNQAAELYKEMEPSQFTPGQDQST